MRTRTCGTRSGCPIRRYYSSILLEELMKAIKYSQASAEPRFEPNTNEGKCELP
jgi:hypothetical protein